MEAIPTTSPEPGVVLLTGATGYVGGRLLRVLERDGHRVRCLAREPAHLAARIAPGSEIVAGDVVKGEGLREAMLGVETAYYLVHSMSSGNAFEQAAPAVPGEMRWHLFFRVVVEQDLALQKSRSGSFRGGAFLGRALRLVAGGFDWQQRS